jgi:hypothetical protein
MVNLYNFLLDKARGTCHILLMELDRLTNRQLETAFGFSFPQVKRWAVACLGKDPEADYAGGVHRKYSLDDAYKIFSMGRLVTEYHFTLNQAKEHIDNVWPIFAAETLLPSQNWNKEVIEIGRIYLTIFAAEQAQYELERIIELKEIKKTGDKVELWKRYEVMSWPQGHNIEVSAPQYIIPINRLLREFISGIKALG